MFLTFSYSFDNLDFNKNLNLKYSKTNFKKIEIKIPEVMNKLKIQSRIDTGLTSYQKNKIAHQTRGKFFHL